MTAEWPSGTVIAVPSAMGEGGDNSASRAVQHRECEHDESAGTSPVQRQRPPPGLTHTESRPEIGLDSGHVGVAACRARLAFGMVMMM